MSVNASGHSLGVNIEAVGLNGIDISGSVVAVEIYEGLRDGFVEMGIMIVDVASLIHSIDMRRLNTVEFSFSEHSGNKDEEPVVYTKQLTLNAINNYQRDIGENKDTYILSCINPSAILNERVCVSRSFTKTTISTIVERMLDLIKYEGPRFIEPTSYTRDLVVPSICPIDVISWLLRHAVSNKSDAGDYIFYEDIDGVHFKPFNTLVNDMEDVVRTYYISSPNLQSTNSDYDLEPTQITINKVQDIFEDVGLSSEDLTLNFVDIETGTQRTVTVDERKSKIESDEVYELDIADHSPKSTTLLDTGFYSAFKEQKIPRLGRALINKGRIQRTFASVELPGENAIKPGSVISIEHYNDLEEEMNPVYSGRWLVDSVKRIITSNTYKIHADIISDRIIEGED